MLVKVDVSNATIGVLDMAQQSELEVYSAYLRSQQPHASDMTTKGLFCRTNSLPRSICRGTGWVL